jgi:hypothetical protein
MNIWLTLNIYPSCKRPGYVILYRWVARLALPAGPCVTSCVPLSPEKGQIAAFFNTKPVLITSSSKKDTRQIFQQKSLYQLDILFQTNPIEQFVGIHRANQPQSRVQRLTASGHVVGNRANAILPFWPFRRRAAHSFPVNCQHQSPYSNTHHDSLNTNITARW